MLLFASKDTTLFRLAFLETALKARPASACLPTVAVPQLDQKWAEEWAVWLHRDDLAIVFWETTTAPGSLPPFRRPLQSTAMQYQGARIRNGRRSCHNPHPKQCRDSGTGPPQSSAVDSIWFRQNKGWLQSDPCGRWAAPMAHPPAPSWGLGTASTGLSWPVRVRQPLPNRGVHSPAVSLHWLSARAVQPFIQRRWRPLAYHGDSAHV